MSDALTAKRYARAWFELARERNDLETAAREARTLAALLDKSEDLRVFLRHPLIPSPRRQAVLKSLFEPRVSASTLQFLLFLESRGRLGLLSRVLDQFPLFYDDHVGLLRAHVTSARALEPSQLERIAGLLKQRYGRAVATTTSVNPELLGGFRVQVGDRVLDASVRTSLTSLRNRLIHAE